MVSEKTLSEILKVLEKHLPSQEEVRAFILDLIRVKGNKFFTDTVKALERLTR